MIIEPDDPSRLPEYPGRIGKTSDGQPLIVYHITISPQKLKVDMVLDFLNFPTRHELGVWCKNFVFGLYEEYFELLIEASDWPEAMNLEHRQLHLRPESLGRPLGEIQVQRYAVINNPGKLEIIESGNGIADQEDTP